jgi:4-diphosphocytidyl-2-C-methyl-D-erythritol kinase
MIGLDRVFGLNLGVERLRALAMQLGSDVGYFVSAGQSGPPPAVVTGFGEAVRSVPHAPARVLLVIPPFGCPTGPVYQAYDRLLAQRAQTEPTRRAAIANEDLSEKRRRKVLHAIGRGEGFPSELLFNDLTHAAFAVEPRLGRMVTALANTLRTPIHMTGSGSCLFAIPPAPKAERMLQHARSLLTDVEPGSAALLADLLAGGNA